MTDIAFDTHRLIVALQQAGFKDAQAEAIVDMVKKVHHEADLATKADLRELRYQLIISLGGMLAVAVSILAVLMRLL